MIKFCLNTKKLGSLYSRYFEKSQAPLNRAFHRTRSFCLYMCSSEIFFENISNAQ